MKLRELRQIINNDQLNEETLQNFVIALEHHTYKQIPGTRNSYRVDAENTSTKTQKHAHVYAKPNGVGKELYSVNMNGSGHDGSSGTVIPMRHAEHFRKLGFKIPDNLALESLDYSSLDLGMYEFCVLDDDVS